MNNPRLSVVAMLAVALPVCAQTAPAHLQGRVLDPLGAAVANAQVSVLHVVDGRETVAGAAVSSSDGSYALSLAAAGQYRVRITAASFPVTTLPPAFIGSHERRDLTLDTPTLSEEVTVTATGTPTTQAQSGAPITILTPKQDYLEAAEVQNPLRLVPGVQMTQTGQAGGTTALFIRGGQSNYNKVLLDGVPMNDVGGNVEFANLATVGIAKIEVLRQPNSVLFGSDDLSGVVQLTTTRGTTPLPQFTYAIDGGSLGQFQQEAEIAGAHKRLDYYGGIQRLQTDNNVPDDEFHNVTGAANLGYALDAQTNLRFIFRHLDTNAGQPNALALYGIPDFANQKEQDTYLTGSLDQQTTNRWHNLLQYGHQALHSQFQQYAPDGTLYTDPTYGPLYYLGLNETIHGANGYSVSGQGVLDYFESYPSSYNTTATRDFVYARTDYRFNSHVTVLGTFKYEAERGSAYDSGDGSLNTVNEGNYSYTLQVDGDVASRLFYTLGSGIEDNVVYGKALTPRATVAYYLRRPGSNDFFAGTKLHGSFGKGVKEGTVAEQAGSLYGLFESLSGGPALIAQYGVRPLGAEYSRTYDAGVEQLLAGGRVRANLSYFHNEYTNGIQYVSQSALTMLGVPAANADATEFGAYVNSQAYRAQGAELNLEARITSHLFARAGYTYLDAVEQRSFSSDALSPSFNTGSSFASTPIGVYAPLDGARPFRLAPHSGYFALDYTAARLTTQLTGTLVSRRDDSDFLSDAAGDGNLLLPNRNLDGAYQRLALMTDYRVTNHLTAYADLENLLNEHYQEAFGYPALPFTVRGGVRFVFGGESFRMH